MRRALFVLAAGLPLAGAPLAVQAGAGTALSIVESPNSSISQRNVLYDVTCSGVNDCWAVGWHGSTAGARTLIERHTYKGWALFSSPNAISGGDNVLHAITCLTDSDCWAVGYTFGGGSELTLTEHFDGRAWRAVASANASSFDSLSDVACATATDCWAVGQFESATSTGQLIEHFDGVRWRVISSPTAGTATTLLDGVTCAHDGSCWAVGTRSIENRFRTLIERRTSGGWSIVPGTAVGPNTDDVLTAVTCISQRDCWAVGHFAQEFSLDQTLTEHYSGSGWSVVSSANAAGQGNDLFDVACVSHGVCWAAGEFTDAQGRPQTLIEQRTSSGWIVVNSPQRGAFFSGLSGLSCTFAGDCWAAGSYGTSSTLNQTLIVHGVATTGPDLAMNLRAASTATAGHTVTYRLHIANHGPGDAADVRVHFTLPPRATFVGASAAGAVDTNNDSVRWRLSKLSALEEVTLTVTLRMDQPGNAQARASAYASTPDPNLANNASIASTVVSTP